MNTTARNRVRRIENKIQLDTTNEPQEPVKIEFINAKGKVKTDKTIYYTTGKNDALEMVDRKTFVASQKAYDKALKCPENKSRKQG